MGWTAISIMNPHRCGWIASELPDLLFRARLLPAFEMSEKKLDRFVAASGDISRPKEFVRKVEGRIIYGLKAGLGATVEMIVERVAEIPSALKHA